MKRKFNRDYWYGFSVGILIILILAFLFYIGFFYYDYKTSSKINIDPEGISIIINECSNLTISESAHCVRDITKTFFKYNISNIEKNLDFETLKREGGMCESWADYWCKIGDELGYYTKKTSLNIGYCAFEYEGEYKEFRMNHEICFWSNEEYYIKLDGLDLDESKFDASYCGEGEFNENLTSDHQ